MANDLTRTGPSLFRTPRQFDRRRLLRAGAGAAAAAGFVGARSSGFAAPTHMRGGRTAAGQELEAAEINFYFGANPDEARTRQTVIDAFQEKFPQITVNPQVAEGDPLQELQTQFAGGAGPDVMMAWELTYSGLATRNVMADLTERIAADAEFAQVVAEDHEPSLLDMFNWDGKQYVLPEQFAGVALYYNKTIFADAGLEVPPADWTDESWTWERFLETAEALTVRDGDRVTQFGFADAWWMPLSATVIATGNGGNWFDTYVDPQASTITDPKMVEGLQWYADLANVHRVAPNAEEIATQAGPDMFMGGRVAMVLVGHWMYPAFSGTEGLDFDLAVLPVGPQGTTPKTDLGSTGLAISASTEYPDHAWEFVKFSTSPEGQEIIAQSGLFVPVLKSVGQSEAYLSSHPAIENATVFTDGLAHSVPLPITTMWGEIAAIGDRELGAVWRGEANAADVCAALEPQINDLLARG
ncbi:sugar ABC transporter substrate-binding protein [soil metagenome]